MNKKLSLIVSGIMIISLSSASIANAKDRTNTEMECYRYNNIKSYKVLPVKGNVSKNLPQKNTPTKSTLVKVTIPKDTPIKITPPKSTPVKGTAPKDTPIKPSIEYDLNKDGKIDINDVIECKKIIFSTGEYSAKVDYNNDKVLDIKDYEILLQYVEKISTPVSPIPTPGTGHVTLGLEFDVNKDGKVDELDLAVVEKADLYSGKIYYAEYDFNRDGSSDIWDYRFLEDNLFNYTYKAYPDINKDGLINDDDCKYIINSLNQSSQYNLNKDGYISKEDYNYLYFHMPVWGSGTPIPDTDPNLIRIDGLEIDFYNDGKIDCNDLESIPQNTIEPKPTPTPAIVPIDYDLNKDGLVDLKDLDKVAEAIGLSMVYDFDGSGQFDKKDLLFIYNMNLMYDLNSDGKSDNNDIMMVEEVYGDTFCFDFNKDGKLDRNDYLYMLSVI